MANFMNFPETPLEFLKSYEFKDKEEIYTNGSMLIPTFRVEQMIEHYFKPQFLADLQDVARCKECEKKKMTNLEKVRKMGIFELADFLSNGVGCPRDKCIAKCDCIKCFVEWLKSEVEE